MDDLSELGLMQLSDSFFPTGLYTMSNGLEVLQIQKIVTCSDHVFDFIEMYLQHQIGPADCVAAANAYRFCEDNDLDAIFFVDDLLYKMKLIKEQRDAISRSGKQLIKCICSFSNNTLLQNYSEAVNASKSPCSYPVSLSVSAYSLGISKKKMCLMLLYGFAVSMIGAALRLGIIHHFESQKILHDLKPIISKIVEKHIDRGIEQIRQFSPEADVIQIKHEMLDSKMFIT